MALAGEAPDLIGKGRLGWEQGCISGQVFDFDGWYVTKEPGSTYVAHGHQLRVVEPDQSTTR
jgi:hypothetical protein